MSLFPIVICATEKGTGCVNLNTCLVEASNQYEATGMAFTIAHKLYPSEQFHSHCGKA